MTRLVIIGAGGHGKVAADCAKSTERFTEIMFLDSQFPEHPGFCGWQVVGQPEDFANFADGAEFFVAIGNNAARQSWQGRLQENGHKLATLIHPSSVIGTEVSIAEGTLVLGNAVINVLCKIGQGCIINTTASIDHDCVLGDYVHVAPGVRCAGTVSLDDRVFMGVASAAIPGVKIGHDTIIGAGSTVLNDIPADVTAVGTPARVIKMNSDRG